MKNSPTENQPVRQFRNSLGSGIKSLFNSKGRRYFILEHRTNSMAHRAGEIQEIIVDYIELGRDNKCQVRFGPDMPTVSRRHAAITKEGENWIIKHLSTTNQTLVNGRPVSRQWYLENGDEIQLSAEGPKVGFIVPRVNTVNSLSFSKRLSLFLEQALRPYKNIITALTILLIFAIAGGGWGIYQTNKRISRMAYEIVVLRKISERERDSLQQLLQQQKADSERNREIQLQLTRRIFELERTISRMPPTNSRIPVQNIDPIDSAQAARFSALYPHVYQIILETITILSNNEDTTLDFQIRGSGFLLNDGRFVTARHVIEPWYYYEYGNNEEISGLLMTLNAKIQLGANVTASFKALSPSGRSFSFTNHDMTVDRSADESFLAIDNEGNLFEVVSASEQESTDWASIRTNFTDGLVYDTQLSNNLAARTQLDVLGYPLGLAASSGNTFSPIYGSCTVGADGLQNGVILITARNFEHGNSGGPVFVYKNRQYIVVGIISAGAGDNIGFVVPISAVR